MTIDNRELLTMALVGYESELAKIKDNMARLAKRVGRKTTFQTEVVVGKRHHISPAGRKRIAEAQRRRWAEFHKKQ